jgi:hypothetical protein
MWNFRTNRRQRGTLLAALILALVCLIMFVALHFAEAKRPDIVVYPAGYQMPANQGPLLERLIPLNWVWAWKLRDKLRGKAKVILITGRGFRVKGSADAMVSKLGFGLPASAGGETKVWIVQTTAAGDSLARLTELSEAAEIFNGRIQTSPDYEADLSMGSGVPTSLGMVEAGIRLQTFPRLRAGKVDLTALFTYTEAVTNSFDLAAQAPRPRISIHTNGAIALRVQMPQSGSVLTLTPEKGSQTNACIVLLLSAKQQ